MISEEMFQGGFLALSVGYRLSCTEGFERPQGDVPFCFFVGSVRSNSDVQVINVGEQQLVSMSRRDGDAFLLLIPSKSLH